MKTIRLGDLAAIDISNVDKKAKAEETSVTLCNFVDVYHNWIIDDSNTRSLMQATARQTQIERFSLRHGQVAITKDSETRDDIGIPTFIDKVPDKTVLGYHCALITPIDNMLDGAYLNCILQTDYAKKYFECNASGSGQRYTLTVEVIADFPVPLPSLDEQIKRAEIFTAIHRTLSNSQSICSDLEATAKLLYDYWFVQFDFPDENGRPYKSSGGKMVWNDELKREIPAGWSAGRLEDLMRITMGQSPSGDSYNAENEGTVFFQGRAEFGDYYPRKNLYTTSPKRLANADDVLLSVRAPVGDINFAFEDCCIGRGLASIRDRCNCPLYAWFTAKSLSVYFKRAGSNGTTFGAIDKDGLAALPVVIPTAEARSAFASLANPIYEELREAESEILELSEARDFLLPLLMNGQVTIGDGGK